MLNPLLILATLMLSSPSHAEDRAVAAIDAKAEATSYNEESARSFFEPKTEADINALATLDLEWETNLDLEN